MSGFFLPPVEMMKRPRVTLDDLANLSDEELGITAADLEQLPEDLPQPGIYESVISGLAGIQPRMRPRNFEEGLVSGLVWGLGSAGQRAQARSAQLQESLAAKRAETQRRNLEETRRYKQERAKAVGELRREALKNPEPGPPEYRAKLQKIEDEEKARAAGKAAQHHRRHGRAHQRAGGHGVGALRRVRLHSRQRDSGPLPAVHFLPRRGGARGLQRCIGRRAFSAFCGSTNTPPRSSWADTGSMAIGARLARLAFLTRQEMLFTLAGGIFVASIASSLIQEKVGLRLGRRIFLRAPLHHAQTHKGIAEPKVVVRYWIVSIELAILAALSIKVR